MSHLSDARPLRLAAWYVPALVSGGATTQECETRDRRRRSVVAAGRAAASRTRDGTIRAHQPRRRQGQDPSP